MHPNTPGPGRFFLIVLFVAAAVVTTWASYRCFRTYNDSLPNGCDQFGYLYLSQAIAHGKMFSEHTERPFLQPLTDYLRGEGDKTGDFAWMITPHAYLYHPDGNVKIVNQYPPGTSLLLAGIPFDQRKLAFPAVIGFSLCLLLLLFVRQEGLRFFSGSILVIALIWLSFFVDPFSDSYHGVNSVAPTLALLIASGFFLRSRPALALALLSASILFRISNIWLLPGPAVVYVFREYFLGEKRVRPVWKSFLQRSGGSLLIAMVCGAGWILLYQWVLMGNPFSTGYSSLDQQGAGLARAAENARYYLSFSQSWFIAHIALLALVTVAFSPKGLRRWIVWALLLCAWNYLFYIFHEVQIPYYPYAGAAILIGLAMSRLKDCRDVACLSVSYASAALILFSVLHMWPACQEKLSLPSPDEQAGWYQQAFGKADVVWGELSSGTVEYATGKAGFRLVWGKNNARIHAMRWLAENGYTQAVYIDDGGITPDKAFNALEQSGLDYSVSDSARFHHIAWITPQKTGSARKADKTEDK